AVPLRKVADDPAQRKERDLDKVLVPVIPDGHFLLPVLIDSKNNGVDTEKQTASCPSKQRKP
ncbi:hypothetical protein, partial [Eubacterium ramulus]|uniref:hypothetical protein n=1 Tax=Eubacterium ramulus TaxID=39490 RepID=UPI0022E72ED6